MFTQPDFTSGQSIQHSDEFHSSDEEFGTKHYPTHPKSLRQNKKRSHKELWEYNMKLGWESLFFNVIQLFFETENIESVLSEVCPCSDNLPESVPCPRKFTAAEIFEVRFARKNMTAADEYAARFQDLLGAKERLAWFDKKANGQSERKARLSFRLLHRNGHSREFRYFLVIFARIWYYYNWVVRRTWSKIRKGSGHAEFGRPRLSEDVKSNPVKSVASMDCLEWIKQWGHLAGEVDASPKDYDLVLDPFDKTEVYEDYRHRFQFTHLGSSNTHPCSYRQFKRILKHWMETSRVRVRAKKNITTKCDSECSKSYHAIASIDICVYIFQL